MLDTREFVNLTGFHITVVNWDDKIVAQIPAVHGHKKATPAHQFDKVNLQPDEEYPEIQIRDVAISHIKNLRLPLDPDKTFIVPQQTALLASFVFDYDNVVCPDLGDTALRSDDGRIIGVRRFLRYVEDVAMPVGGAWAGDASVGD